MVVGWQLRRVRFTEFGMAAVSRIGMLGRVGILGLEVSPTFVGKGSHISNWADYT